MALLAEQKRKARFGLDPRNTSWSNDTSKFGQRLMEKMGWEKGKGLGANENGITEHIRATYKSDSRGLGCTPQDADAWIAHQDDFNDLLKALNSQSETGSQEKKVKRTEHVDGRKRYYGRFARGQVQTLRSTEDLDCIFGKRKGKSKTAEPDEQPVPEPDCGDGKEKSHGLTTVTSTSSVQEYFAKKMAEMKARKEVNTREDDSGETSQRGKDGVNCEEKKKRQKSSLFGSVSFSYDEVREVSGSAGVEGAASKPCRGWYKDFLENRSGNVENIEAEVKSSKKKKQKKTKSDTEDNDFKEKVKISDSKKQKKKDKVLDDSLAVVNSCSVLESHKLPSTDEVAEKRQSKKKKKNKDSEAVPAAAVYKGVSTENINEEKEDVKKQKEKRKASTKDEGEDKKQSKKKNKENEAGPAASVCEVVNTVNINNENEDKKKQKKKRKASNKDEIEVSSLNKCALDADEVDVNETVIDASSLKHSSKRLVTHSNDDNKQEKENSGSTGHKKKNKKRKQSEIIDEESKPVENKCDNNDEVAVESKKKKKKRKHSEINDEESKPVESECDKNDDATVEPKKKRRKGNDNDVQDTEDPAAAEHKSNISSGNQNIIDVSQSSEQKQKKKRKRKKKAKPLQDQRVKSNAFFPGSNLADIVGYGHKSRETKKCSKEDNKSSKQKV